MGLRVAVVGAGISGLACAFRIQQRCAASGTALELHVLEADERAGGTIHTREVDGFRLESGPNGFLDSKPETMDLVKDLGIEDQLLRSDDASRRRFVMVGGQLIELPSSPPAFMKSPLLPLGARLRVVREMWVSKRTDGADETVAEFATRRLGPKAYERLVDPFVSGIFAGDPTKLSLKAAFPRLAELEAEYGSLITASRKLAKERENDPDRNAAGPSGRLTSFPKGMSTLVHALTTALEGAVHTGERVRDVRRTSDGWTVTTTGQTLERLDKVVLAIPAGAAASILGRLDDALALPLSRIPYPAVAVVALGFRREQVKHPLDGFGFLIPSTEKRNILGCLWTSSIFPGHRAPHGHVLLRSMCGGARNSDFALQDDASLTSAVRQELDGLLGLNGEPALTSIQRWPQAIPQYVQGHLERREALYETLAKYEGLYVTGNALKGVGVNDCTREAAVVAERVVG